jgi:hypothetical protein
MLIIVMISFAVLFYMLQQNAIIVLKTHPKFEPYTIVENYIGETYLDSLMSVYLLALGDFADRENYQNLPDANDDKEFAWVIFICGTILI